MRPEKDGRSRDEITDAAELLRWVVANADAGVDRIAAENVLHAFEWVTGHPGGEWLTDLLATTRANREAVIKPNLSSSRVRAKIEAGRKRVTELVEVRP